MKMISRKNVALALVLLLWASFALAAGSKGDGGRWFVLTMDSQKIGFLKEVASSRPEDCGLVLMTAQNSWIVLNRLGKKVEMKVVLVYEEDADGRLLRFRAEAALSNQVARTEGEVGPGTITLTTKIGDGSKTLSLPVEGNLLGPAGIRTASAALWAGTAPSVGFITFSPELNRALRVTREIEGRETVAAASGLIACLRLKETSVEKPIARIVWIDREGFEVKTSEPSPFGEIQSLLADETAADLASAGNLSEERYGRTIIRSNIRLPQARLIESLTLKLTHRHPEFGWPDLEGPGQTVLERSPGTVLLRVERAAKSQAALIPPVKDDLAANAYIDIDDPAVREVLPVAAGAEKEPMRRALRLERWVSENMTFDLGVVFAPSRELIRERRGTCVGYAGLLATLSRASGIPSRVLFGFVYVNGMWGGHAWVEMFLDGRWQAFDSAVNGPGPADSARFTFARSNMRVGPADLLTGGQQLFGNLEVEVLDYTIAGRTERVPEGRPIYRVEGDTYSNAGLGFSLVKPAGFAFADMDKIWPDSTLLRMTGPSGEVVIIKQDRWLPGRTAEAMSRALADAQVDGGRAVGTEIQGRQASLKSNSGRAVAAIIDAADAWVVVAEGGEAEALLKRVLAGLKLGPARAFPGEE